MSTFSRKFGLHLCLMTIVMGTNLAQAYDNEVFYRNGRYRWKINNVESGDSTDYATAVQACINAVPNSWVDITCDGNVTSTINLVDGTKLNFHDNRVNIWLDGEHEAFYARGRNNCSMINAVIDGGKNWFVIHFTDCDNSSFSGLTVQNNSGIGIRCDSHPSRPYEDYWDTGLTINNCNFYNMGSHGIETYGIIDADIQNIVATDCGGCGVCPNKTIDSYFNNIYATRCCVDAGYAGLRLVNECNNVHVGYLSAVGCGRGFVTGKAHNITVDEVSIRDSVIHDILITLESSNIRINSGSYNKVGLIHYSAGTGNYIGAIPVGYRKIVNTASGRSLDANGDSDGSNVGIWDDWGGANQRWNIDYQGSGNFSIRSAQSGARALDAGWNPADGGNVITWSYWGGNPQFWQILAVDSQTYKVVPKLNTSECMDSYGTSNGSNVGLWSYWGGSNQKWRME